MKKILSVEGMTCAHCVAHVKEALKKVPGVAEAAVSLENKEATVTLNQDVADQTLLEAIKAAGYEATACRSAE